MASSLCEVKIGAGAWQSVASGVNVSPGDVITVRLASSSGVTAGAWTFACFSTDDTKTVSGINALLTVNAMTFEASFTVPAGTGQALLFQSIINGDSTTRTTFGLYVLVNGFRVGAVDETLEGSASFGWAKKVNDFIRAGTFSAPSGTGVVSVTGGSLDAVAGKLVVGVLVSTLTGNRDAFDPGNATTIRFTGAGAVNLRGITGGVDGRILIIHNRTGSNVTLVHESGAATAANRIDEPSGADYPFATESSAILQYDGTNSRWVRISYM